MRLNDETYEEIKHVVADMFTDYDIKGLPISAFEVATKIGLRVIPYSSLSKQARKQAHRYSKDGFSTEANDGKWTIYYNDDDRNYSRINQTIMHEIGHYLLGHMEEGEAEEAEASFFAKYALASPPLIHNMKGQKTIENIMENFDIGYAASMYALDYYKKWLKYGEPDYTVYELKILGLLEFEIA